MTDNTVDARQVVEFFLERAEALRFSGKAREGDAVRSAVNDFMKALEYSPATGYVLVIDGDAEVMPYDQVDAILAVHAAGMMTTPANGAVVTMVDNGVEKVVSGSGSPEDTVVFASIEFENESPRTVGGVTYQPDEVAAVIAAMLISTVNNLATGGHDLITRKSDGE